jgi:hypothetical protein
MNKKKNTKNNIGRDLNFKTPETGTFIGSKKMVGTRNAQTTNEYDFKV